MGKVITAKARTTVVNSTEETTVIINHVRYDIPRGEDIEVPVEVAEALVEGGFVAQGKVI